LTFRALLRVIMTPPLLGAYTQSKKILETTNNVEPLRGLKVHIHEFQNMMRQIYFHRDSERGTTGTYKWLVDEVKELEEAIGTQDAKAIMDEFADVLAWLASLANIVDIDLEKAATWKYDGTCPKCHKSPCQCSLLSKAH